MPIRTAQPRKVSRRKYWDLKLKAAPTESARLGEACDYLRAMAASYPDPQAAQAVLKQAADDLVEKAQQLGRKVR